MDISIIMISKEINKKNENKINQLALLIINYFCTRYDLSCNYRSFGENETKLLNRNCSFGIDCRKKIEKKEEKSANKTWQNRMYGARQNDHEHFMLLTNFKHEESGEQRLFISFFLSFSRSFFPIFFEKLVRNFWGKVHCHVHVTCTL